MDLYILGEEPINLNHLCNFLEFTKGFQNSVPSRNGGLSTLSSIPPCGENQGEGENVKTVVRSLRAFFLHLDSPPQRVTRKEDY